MKSDLPVRSGLARLATWSWMFKFHLERLGDLHPDVRAAVPRRQIRRRATEADKETLFRAVANIAGDYAAIVPESMTIDFITTPNVGEGARLYRERADWLDQQMSKAVLGQTATTDAIAGGHAVGQEHRQVQEDIERADAKALSAVLNRDLGKPWIDLEYGPQKANPRIKIARPEEEDLAQLADSLVNWFRSGCGWRRAWWATSSAGRTHQPARWC